MLKHLKLNTEFTKSFQDFLKSNNSFKTVLVSGGTQLQQLDDTFIKLSKAGTDFTKLTVALVDERYGNDTDSNFNRLTGLEGAKKIKQLGAKFMPIVKKGDDIHKARRGYNSFLEKVFNSDSTTLAILGLGTDFHIAGILPHKVHDSYIFYETNVVSYNLDEISTSDNEYRNRITITFSAMAKFDEVWVYAVGKSKKSVIQEFWKMLDNPDIANINQIPAHALALLPELTLFTDQTV